MEAIRNSNVTIPMGMGNFSIKQNAEQQLKKILVPFSYDDESIGALNYAAMLASSMNAEITALHLAATKDYRTKSEFHDEVKKLVSSKLRPRLTEIQKLYPSIEKIKLQYLGMEKPVHEHIVSFVEENEIDFVVMRSHGLPKKNDFELHFKNTTAFKVVMACPCPVFTFTMIPQRLFIKDILMPLDLSDGSLKKVPFAIALAKEHGAKIHLLSAIEHKEDRQELIEQMEEVYDLVRKSGVKHIKQIMFDKLLIDSIDEYVENHQIDLLVVMSKPSFKWSDFWVSPKAKRVIAQSKIPVLSIRPTVPLRMSGHIE